MTTQWQVIWSLILIYIAYRAKRSRSLSLDGAIVGWFVGAIHVISSTTHVILMALFFYSATYWTKYKQEIKKKFEEDFQEGGNRNSLQVLANAGVATTLCIVNIFVYGGGDFPIDFKSHWWRSFWNLAIMGTYACVNGDTWSSEIGILSHSDPVLITTFRKVPKGTNGGVTVLGLFAAAGGGLLIGTAHYLCILFFASKPIYEPQWPIIVLGAIGGLGGSLIDSFLGATLQWSGWDSNTQKVVKTHSKNIQHISGINVLSNNQVNFLSALFTAFFVPIIGSLVFAS
jgi:uncharacterized protein (TIGR00297 family)